MQELRSFVRGLRTAVTVGRLHARTDAVSLLVAAQALFLTIGITRLEFEVSWLAVVITVSVAVGTELVLLYATKRKIIFPTSAIAAALGIAIFFRSEYIALYAAAGCIAVASKYVIRRGGRHVFNPSNIAIVALVVGLPSMATIEFTQWGDSIALSAMITFVSFLIVLYARVAAITVSFVVSYTLVLLVFVSYRPDIFSAHHYGLIGPSFVLFASFMITDPRTVPAGTRARILHGISITFLYFFLESVGVRYGLFITTFCVTCLNVASETLYARMALLQRLVPGMKNIGTFLIACGLIWYAVSSLPEKSSLQFDVTRINPLFILMGIKSDSLVQCKKDPLFATVPNDQFGDGSVYGAAWGDYDGDGYDDLLVSTLDRPSRLYHNDNGTFTDVTVAAGLPEISTSSGFFADYDNDARPDLFLVFPMPIDAHIALYSAGYANLSSFIQAKRGQAIRVYRNVGSGRFVEVTRALGLESFVLDLRSTGTMTFADYNNDGFLDFMFSQRGRAFSRNYSFGREAISKTLFDPFFKTSFTLVCKNDDVRRLLGANELGRTLSQQDIDAFVDGRGCLYIQDQISGFLSSIWTPVPSSKSVETMFHIPGSVHLFENKNGGRFVEHAEFTTEISQRLAEDNTVVRKRTFPFSTVSGRFYQPVSFDYDSDGQVDVFIGTDLGSNVLLKNEGGLQFSDATVVAQMNYAGTGMGVDVADIDHNGLPDVFVSNTNEDYVFSNEGNGTFSLLPDKLGLLGIGWGTSHIDYDLDGWDDIITANGDILGTTPIPFGTIGQSFFRSDTLYRNEGGTGWRDATWDELCPEPKSGMALAVSDYNNDGTPDVFVGNIKVNRPPITEGGVLYTNTLAGANFLKILLRGSVSNSAGIGSVVTLSVGSSTQTKYVLAGNSFQSQNSNAVLFGLGTATVADTVNVRWPSGKTSTLHGVPSNQTLLINEPRI